ncbi:cytochrome c assembly protein [Capnocytophaga stomatis]|uniref:Cytochrome C assembly protein n=1 Tax=Capnocytophaga stomatis TaxID=1848904 RepID=A0A250G2J1_9FLAO|nr:cytochrome c biogenesis protein CcsA [Capnocytophaga stomatis]ATA90407.1 cytochrome C assembly protein [Capnocytophaga stomatis]GIJ94143.1 cytochrome c assembly protein [Capnocytophaga stomatis]GIJ97134.1 cytochrome c assembly protein [Capnocytophaga stomatis]
MWQYFNYITFVTLALWIVSGIFIYSKSPIYRKLSLFFHLLATVIIGVFIAKLWIELDRPPLRTLAETRIWYAFFMGLIGFSIYLLYRQKWMLNYSALMGVVFMLVTFFRPDTMNKTLMPALQSVWFIPHVIVYIFAYAMLGMASLTAIYGMYLCKKQKDTEKTALVTDQLIKIGYAFLTFGLLFGALWAKEAWGHYWTWDPKETWAFITWLAYLVYIHYKYKHKEKKQFNNFLIVVIAFLLLLVCWFGVNYLPTAQMSVHTYSG